MRRLKSLVSDFSNKSSMQHSVSVNPNFLCWLVGRNRSQPGTTLYSTIVSLWFSLCRGYVWNKIISKLIQPSSTSVWNNFILARGNLPETVSKWYCFACKHGISETETRRRLTIWHDRKPDKTRWRLVRNGFSVPRPRAVVTCEIKLFQNYFRGLYCSSWIFSNMFNVAEIILK